MEFRKLALASAAFTIAAMPVAVHAEPARASAPTSEASSLRDGEWLNALIIIAIAAAGMLALILSDDDPSSP